MKEKIDELLKKAFGGLGFNESDAFCTFSARPELCDFQCNSAFSLAKKAGKNPMEIAKIIVERLGENKDFVFEVCAPAFINIKVTDLGLTTYANEILNLEHLGVKKHSNPKTILLDYGGANVAKELHVGHLRSPLIGESLKRLYIFLGDEVISDSHLGDWGLQMGLTFAGLEEEGVLNGENKQKITLALLNEIYPKASKRKNIDEEFKTKAENYTLKIQRKEEPYFTYYKEIRECSVNAIKENYKNLNAYFDLWYGESDSSPYIEETIKLFKEKNLARESEGALVVDVAKEGENIPIVKVNENGEEVILFKNPMPPAIIQKYNGGELYATTDIATILMRNKMFKLDEIQYVVDARQAMHFEQVFRCCKLAGITNENQKLVHIGFGTMNGSDGKPFKTRDGGIIKLEDVIGMLTGKAQEKLTENGLGDNPELARQIGVAAMKFGDLSNNVSKDYVFDMERFMSFEGKTGPYLQYTATRIKSLLKKGEFKSGQISISTPEERKIVLALIKLLSVYEICYEEKSLNNLCSSVFDISAAFSTFYNNCRVISEPDSKKRENYLTISFLALKAIEDALYVLAIDVPDRM